LRSQQSGVRSCHSWKKPVEVDVFLFPGDPSETIDVNCPDTGDMNLQNFLWFDGWLTL
jgi:hypothetical protein